MQAVPPLQQGHHPDARGPAVLPAGSGGGGAAATGRGGDPPGRQPGERVAVDQRQRGGPAYDPAGQAVHFPGAVPGGTPAHHQRDHPPGHRAAAGRGERLCRHHRAAAHRPHPAADRAAALYRDTGVRPGLQRHGRPPVHHGRTGKLPPGLPGGGHQYIRFLPELFQQPRPALPGGCGGRHHGPDPAHGGARAGHRFLPQPAGGPPHRPGGAVLHPAGPARPRAGHHPGGGHRPSPFHRHEGHPGADLRKK